LEIDMAHQQFESCIEACNACAAACDYCAASCLQEPDPKAMARCIALDMDCAQICRLAAAYMARSSEFASAICQACADVCDACADECSRHQMQHCQECAQACRRCADECRRMAGMAAGTQRGTTRNLYRGNRSLIDCAAKAGNCKLRILRSPFDEHLSQHFPRIAA
jgi:hypothetical protein